MWRITSSPRLFTARCFPDPMGLFVVVATRVSGSYRCCRLVCGCFCYIPELSGCGSSHPILPGYDSAYVYVYTPLPVAACACTLHCVPSEEESSMLHSLLGDWCLVIGALRKSLVLFLLGSRLCRSDRHQSWIWFDKFATSDRYCCFCRWAVCTSAGSYLQVVQPMADGASRRQQFTSSITHHFCCMRQLTQYITTNNLKKHKISYCHWLTIRNFLRPLKEYAALERLKG